ncbi:MAG: SDR family oxidoreductase [Parcubacteria group bacterium]|jgi:3-oxoacyl-[acyl-carrier protein] reductase
MPKKNIVGKVVAITGGSRGIGFSDAKAFLREGAKVAICSLHKNNLSKAEKELKGRGEFFAMIADVRNHLEMEKFVEAAVKKFGRIDVMINNAGIAWEGYFHDEAVKSINDIVDTNVKGVLFGTKAALKYMLKQKSGVIINMSSQAGEYGIAEFSTYSATKFAVRGFSESMSDELRKFGIKVYAVCPGAVDTDLQLEVTGRRDGIPPERVSELIVRLAEKLPDSNKCFEPQQ